METPISYMQITVCAEREIQHHLNEAASRPRGSHAADIHLGATIGAFDLWRCLMVELGAGERNESCLEALVRLTALSTTTSLPTQGKGESA
ncbi:hypothetical protein [Burkholderia multivorans]|uniref:hypothetical protein n=1 Tax=Burkholderia multivorans TaxID=87883 RepID=UPI0021BE7254|nr:hypothetical protein [Burkholderia multivorans]MDR9053022.1 hypothetical protein [Burkholderia multivorans]MDR9058683.1 hypothetical protein [Burkholderia multivorans]MDR9063100.1 hypothetical protein [Burkholderia multivorans]MDR9070677.1 hypothetical protein [Burkholderia multivorans]MDR9076956.1 hypothetical protein [Burkholderia multivorans]